MPENIVREKNFLGAVLDAMPVAVFVVDEDVAVSAFNKSAAEFLQNEDRGVIHRRAGEALHCIHSVETPGGCGRSEACHKCVIRNAVTACLRDQTTVRAKEKIEIYGQEGGTRPAEIYLLITASPFDFQGERLALLTLQDISELTLLRRILSICSHCKRIRNDEEYWDSVEKFFQEHLDVCFSHGICPECLKLHYPQFAGKLTK